MFHPIHCRLFTLLSLICHPAILTYQQPRPQICGIFRNPSHQPLSCINPVRDPVKLPLLSLHHGVRAPFLSVIFFLFHQVYAHLINRWGPISSFFQPYSGLFVFLHRVILTLPLPLPRGTRSSSVYTWRCLHSSLQLTLGGGDFWHWRIGPPHGVCPAYTAGGGVDQGSRPLHTNVPRVHLV